MTETGESSSDSSWVMPPSVEHSSDSRPAPAPTLEDIRHAFSDEPPNSAEPVREGLSSSYVSHQDRLYSSSWPQPSGRCSGENNHRAQWEQSVTSLTEDLTYDSTPRAAAAASTTTSGSAFAAAQPLLDDDDAPATATVVDVQELSDETVARKIMEEELMMSGRTFDEYLAETLRQEQEIHARHHADDDDDDEEEETKPPARATSEGYASVGARFQSTSSPDTAVDEQAQATMVGEQATVVDITEHFVHPLDVQSNEVQAEFIGQDYSFAVTLPSETPAPAATRAVAAADQHEEESAAEEATVLDSKPAAQSMPTTWSENQTEEATVLGTSPPTESWADADVQVEHTEEEVAVDGVLEDEASVVGITEHDVHPADSVDNEVHATLIGEDFSRSITFSGLTQQPPPVHSRSTSAPELNSPVDAATSSTFRNAIGALDEEQPQVWMDHPTVFAMDGQEPIAIPPPQSSEAVTAATTADDSASSLPVAAAELVDTPVSSERDDAPMPIPPIPQRRPNGRREASGASHSSRASQDSFASESEARHQGASGRDTTTSTAGSDSRGSQRSSLLALPSMAARSTSDVMERLFGTPGSRRTQQGFDLEAAAGSILPRTHLPWSIFYNETSGMWVATVNTNQKALDHHNVAEASKSVRAFSLPSRAQAEALARAWATPRMLPFGDNPVCFICESKFAVFKRACHCRNCGVCVCSACTVHWPSKMIPETYNIKREAMVNICKSCDWLCSAFRLALQNGNHDQAVALHATGNVNLTTPFANVKGELFYPVHCAVLGSSLSLLKWLVDDHCCPLKSVRINNRNKDSSFTPILTSRGRSLLSIAMENKSIDLIRYLVVEKNISMMEEKNLTREMALSALESVLRILPSDDLSLAVSESTERAAAATVTPNRQPVTTPQAPPSNSIFHTPDSPPTEQDIAAMYEIAREEGSSASVEDACIICFANPINCVIMPCAHQICCMECSANITRCPVCSVECTFLRVYKP